MVPRTRFLSVMGDLQRLIAGIEIIQENEPLVPIRDNIFYVVTVYDLDDGWLIGVNNGAAFYYHRRNVIRS